MKKLCTGGLVITMDPDRRVFNKGAVAVEDGIISGVGPTEDFSPGDFDKVYDADDKIVLPGLINTHVHLSQQLARGIGDDVDLMTWLLDRIWPYESAMTEEDSYYSSLLCGLELIRSGVTGFIEAGGQGVGGMAHAVRDLGIKGVLTKSVMDSGDGPDEMIESTEKCIESQRDLIERWDGSAEDRIHVWTSLRTIFNCSDDLFRETNRLAEAYDVGIHAHVAEIEDEIDYSLETRGARTVTHLNDLGLLSPRFLAAHAVWLTDREVSILADSGASVTHNPAAALRVLGFAKIPEMVRDGVNVTIGTDGAPSNNRMNMISEMYLTALIHKGNKLDPEVLPAERVLEMATINGARAYMMEEQIGSLEEGKDADILILNPETPNMLPLHDPISNLVYAVNSTNVESVLVRGEPVLQNGEVVKVDEGEVISEAKTRARDLLSRAGVDLHPRFEGYERRGS
ncbi:MAG: amidohydrolase [Candidatus Acetothermia bacterium]